jgi:Mn2+/Fe2+ NRAMP family transporter
MKRHDLFKSIGPGILLAGAAIGGSHLLASTTAGAKYGFSLLWIVLLINLLKYPFFEYSQRYTAATGETILDGYRRLGRWELIVFFLLNLLTALANIAGVGLIAGILGAELFGSTASPLVWTTGVIALCVIIMLAGHYKWFDRAMKLQIILLTASTIIALAAAVRYNGGLELSAQPPDIWNRSGLLFLIALMGWMPAPIEISAWASLWMQERSTETGHRATVGEASVDFHIGYIACAVLAVIFLSLGALVMFGSGETLEAGAGFAKQFIELYTRALGGWIRPVIAFAAFITMFSTTLTCIDGYPRSLAASIQRIAPKLSLRFKPLYTATVLIMALLALCVVAFFQSHLKAMLNLAMIFAFLAAPIFAVINYRIVTADFMPVADRPGKAMRTLSWAGIIFLSGFSAVFIVSRFIGN